MRTQTQETIKIADLFCGAGGTSTGAVEAVEALGKRAELTAVNHWTVAVETHTLNHPGARHLCASLDSLNPRDLFKPNELDVLIASPECINHSNARGGKPINEQSRATAWCVVGWADALLPGTILVENVPEFAAWGAVGCNGRPLASKKGQTFAAWTGALESLGYRVECRVLCAANYGDPTTRRRLFIQAVRGKRKIIWPDPTHGGPEEQGGNLLGGLRPWVAAREIIDWSIQGTSIFARKRPLKDKTLARIHAGLKRYGLAPFIQNMEHSGGLRGADQPLATITTAKGGAFGLTEPYLVEMRGTSEDQCQNSGRSLESPLGTITAGGIHHALIEPHLLPQQSCGALRPVSRPAPTVSTAGAIALVEPFLVSCGKQGQTELPEVTIAGKRYLLDIRFRMLQTHELAAAQGFPENYQFSGNKTQAIKQIGNAVPRNMARALILATLGQNNQIGHLLDGLGKAA